MCRLNDFSFRSRGLMRRRRRRSNVWLLGCGYTRKERDREVLGEESKSFHEGCGLLSVNQETMLEKDGKG